jgi:hypothetical protein
VINPVWSYVLSAMGLTVQFLAGNKRWHNAAWILGFVSQFPWLVYAVISDQWGFFISSTCYALVYAYNFYMLHRESGWFVRKPTREEREVSCEG